jgi:hypothetical protein
VTKPRCGTRVFDTPIGVDGGPSDEAVASAIEEVKKLTGAERDRHKE